MQWQLRWKMNKIAIPGAGMTVSRCVWSSFSLSPESIIFTTAVYLSITSCGEKQRPIRKIKYIKKNLILYFKINKLRTTSLHFHIFTSRKGLLSCPKGIQLSPTTDRPHAEVKAWLKGLLLNTSDGFNWPLILWAFSEGFVKLQVSYLGYSLKDGE